jgi:hypothetical protein
MHEKVNVILQSKGLKLVPASDVSPPARSATKEPISAKENHSQFQEKLSPDGHKSLNGTPNSCQSSEISNTDPQLPNKDDNETKSRADRAKIEATEKQSENNRIESRGVRILLENIHCKQNGLNEKSGKEKEGNVDSLPNSNIKESSSGVRRSTRLRTPCTKLKHFQVRSPITRLNLC